MKSTRWLPVLVLLSACGATGGVGGVAGDKESGEPSTGVVAPGATGLIVRVGVGGVT